MYLIRSLIKDPKKKESEPDDFPNPFNPVNTWKDFVEVFEYSRGKRPYTSKTGDACTTVYAFFTVSLGVLIFVLKTFVFKIF